MFLTIFKISLGFILTVLNFYFATENFEKPVVQLAYNKENLKFTFTETSSSNPIFNEENRIFFITPTIHSLVQKPILTRIAQALFPVRDFVTWIVVQDNFIFNNIDNDGKELDEFLKRFGISYILLKGNFDDLSSLTISRQFLIPILKGQGKIEFKIENLKRQIALFWLLKNLKKGILVFASEEFTYDFHLFHKIQKTKKISVWPFGRRERNGGYSNILINESSKIIECGTGKEIESDFIHLDLASFAINFEYLKLFNPTNIWKIAVAEYFTTKSLNISIQDIEFLSSDCTKIFVYQTKCRRPKLPRMIYFPDEIKGTNVDKLLRSIYGKMMDSIPKYSERKISWGIDYFNK